MICWCDEPFIDGLGYHCRGCDKHNHVRQRLDQSGAGGHVSVSRPLVFG